MYGLVKRITARILTKSPRMEHITPVLKKLHWLKIIFLEHSFIYAAPCKWKKNSEHQILIVSGRVLKQCYLHTGA